MLRRKQLTGVPWERHLATALLSLAILGVTLAPEAAAADTGFFGEPRPFALELWATGDAAIGPPRPLTAPGAFARGGAASRLSFGFDGGTELFLGAGWVTATQSQPGTIRTELGMAQTYKTSFFTMYLLGSMGTWSNVGLAPDAWSPGFTLEWRGAFGFRFPVSPFAAVTLEAGVSLLGLDPEAPEGPAVLGVRAGWALGPTRLAQQHGRGRPSGHARSRVRR